MGDKIFEVDEASGLPVWVQLRNRIVYLIKTGHYQDGEQLPSIRTLAAEAAINYNTVSKTYVNLEKEGYVTSVRGKGVFVNAGDTQRADDPAAAIDAVLEDSIRRCLDMGATLDEIKLRMLDVAYRVQLEAATRS